MSDQKKLTPQERYRVALTSYEDAVERQAFAQTVAQYNRACAEISIATDAILDAVDDGADPDLSI